MSRLLSRRDLLNLTAAATAAGAVAGAVWLVDEGDSTSSLRGTTDEHSAHGMNMIPLADAGPAPVITPFSVPLPVPPVLQPTRSTSDTDFYEITAREAKDELLPGISTSVFGYNGTYVGPTIRARVGRQVVIEHANQLAAETAVHLHGGHVPAESDGFPTDTIGPGKTKTYKYPNRQLSATLWYHDHAHHKESENVYRGLHGFYFIEDPAEDALSLPSGDFDVPIMLSDAHFDDKGQLVYMLGDLIGRATLLANGRPTPYLQVQARKYRFRLLNASNMRDFKLVLGKNEKFVQIAGDGGLLPAPVTVDSVFISPGERVEIVIDFSRYPSGTKLVLTNTRDVVDSDSPVSLPVLRFDVDKRTTDTSRVPAVLRPNAPLRSVTRVRDVVLAYDAARFPFTINGKSFDSNRVDFSIKRGTTEIWRVKNLETPLAVGHNIHLHLVQFRVLDRNGVPAGATESGLKDTVFLEPGETVRIQVTFSDYVGKYLFHCHNIDHASEGMMAVFETTA
ncbi:spore coat protein A, manganese oxidase [Frankia sp. Hr75.2]|nr:spore coat protein A, manganese oxidase [Frankia sp. Hr75.2]